MYYPQTSSFPIPVPRTRLLCKLLLRSYAWGSLYILSPGGILRVDTAVCLVHHHALLRRSGVADIVGIVVPEAAADVAVARINVVMPRALCMRTPALCTPGARNVFWARPCSSTDNEARADSTLKETEGKMRRIVNSCLLNGLEPGRLVPRSTRL